MGLSIPSNKRPENPAATLYGLIFPEDRVFLQIVDVSATMLEVLVIHDADLRINVGFDTVDDQLRRNTFMRAIAVTVFTVANQLTDHLSHSTAYGVARVDETPSTHSKPPVRGNR